MPIHIRSLFPFFAQYLRSSFRSLVKSSRLRRSDTWDASLLRKSDDPFQLEAALPPPPFSAPLPSLHSTSGVISFAASGGDGGDTGTESGLRGLRADIFRPDATGSRDTTSVGSGPIYPAHHSSTLTLESGPASADDISLLPTSPKHRSMMRRQFTLPAVLEGEPSSSGVVGKFEFQTVEKKRTQLDINNNNEVVLPDKASTTALQMDSVPLPSLSDGVQAKVAVGDLALPEAMKVPEARPPPPARKFGILDLFVAAAAVGERKNVRNKDMNVMAPQSW